MWYRHTHLYLLLVHKNLLNSNLVSKLVSTATEWIVLSFDTPYYTELPRYSPKRRLKTGSICAIGVAVPLWICYTIFFGFSLFWHFSNITFQHFYYFVWLRITDEGSVPEMRIWSILFIKSDLKWCIHLSRSLCSYQYNTHIDRENMQELRTYLAHYQNESWRNTEYNWLKLMTIKLISKTYHIYSLRIILCIATWL